MKTKKLVKDNNAIAGVNGGLYLSTGNKGGKPLGVVVADGKIIGKPKDYEEAFNLLNIAFQDEAITKEILSNSEDLREKITFYSLERKQIIPKVEVKDNANHIYRNKKIYLDQKECIAKMKLS